MDDVEIISIVFQFLLSSVCLFFLFGLIRFLNEIWLTPIGIQRVLSQQGIKGLSYRFPHGNTKKIINMRKESMSGPMDLSHHIFPRLQPHLYFWLSIYGKNFLNWYDPRAEFIITEVEFIKEIMNRDKSYPKIDMEWYAKRLLGDGLATSKGEKWAKQRKLANHTFHAGSLKNMTPAMIASVELMLERWKQHEGKEIEVFQEFRILTSEVISRTAFGSSYLEEKDIFDVLIKLVIIYSRNCFIVKLPGLGRYFKSNDEIEADKLEQRVHNSILRIMEKREKTSTMSGKVGSFGTDFLGLLMKAKNDADEKNRITVQDVVDQCKTFYVAGQETTTTLLAWILFLLGIHTDWQEKARQEVLKLFGQDNPNSDGIAKQKT